MARLVREQNTMKNDSQSLPQRLTAALTRTSQQLLKRFRNTPAQTGRAEGNTVTIPESQEDELSPGSVRHSFSSELFAALLVELPEHQGKMSQAYQAGDLKGLRNYVHQLLGAIVYCDTPELESALRSLHRALATTDPGTIDACYTRAFNTINSTLTYSGFRGSK